MQNVLNLLVKHQTLTKREAEQAIFDIIDGKLSNECITGLMVALQTRNITLEEVEGFRSALLKLAIRPDLDGTEAVDLCGTGGDGKNTFNISTTTAFVVASMGYKVIKHGNYGVSSMCGSSNVLEHLGLTFTTNNEILQQQLANNNLCFLHAPLFHPAMKEVAHLRKGLGIPTFFNIMGPLVNPVQPEYQMTGTFNLGVGRIYHHLLQGYRKNYKVVYGLDGYDEISMTSEARILGKFEDSIFHPSQVNLQLLKPSEITGGNTIDESAQILTAILKGRGTKAQHQVICLNTAQAIQILHPDNNLIDLYQQVDEHIKTGAPYKTLLKMINN